MDEIDFKTMSVEEGKKIAMAEFGLDEGEALKFTRLARGDDSEGDLRSGKGGTTPPPTTKENRYKELNYLIRYKYGTSAGASAGWDVRGRGRKLAESASSGARNVWRSAAVQDVIRPVVGGAAHGLISSEATRAGAKWGEKLGREYDKNSSDKFGEILGKVMGSSLGAHFGNKVGTRIGQRLAGGGTGRHATAHGISYLAGRGVGTMARPIYHGVKWATSKRGRETIASMASAFSKKEAKPKFDFKKFIEAKKKMKDKKKEFMGEESLDDKLSTLRKGIYKALPGAQNNLYGPEKSMSDGWIRDIFEGFILYEKGGKTYKVPYMELEDDKVQLSAESDWTEVKQTWVPVETDKVSDFTVTKDAKDEWRWTMMSTNAFEDRDGEVISYAALQKDLEASEKEFTEKGNYGPLRWWHVVSDPSNPVATGLDLGLCDFRALEGRILVESGTFNDNRIGEAMASHAKELAGSIGFFHSTSEPDSDKVFNNIRIFERSFLPRERASNPFTLPIIQKEGAIMVKEKLEKLEALLGGKDKADEALKAAKEVQNKAEEAKARTKEVKDPEKVATKDEGAVASDPKPEVTEQDWKDFKAAVRAALEEEFAEQDLAEPETKELNEVKASLKELNDGQNKIADVLASIDGRVKALEGDVPAGVKKGFSASTDTSTKTEKEKHDEPKPDSMNSFVNDFVLARK